jgi:CBS domain-containing protein
MDRRVHTVRPDTDILEAVAFLLKKHVTGAPVVDDSRRVVGMLTEKDCLQLLTEGVQGNLPRGKVSSRRACKATFPAGRWRTSWRPSW